MLKQFLVGGMASVANVCIHALVMTLVVQVARRASTKRKTGSSAYLVMVMTPTVLVLIATHTFEVVVWAVVYLLVGAAPNAANVVYFAFVNYTTLGYGDVVPVAEWQLLGPMTAMTGVLMFGWSTAVIFEVLERALARIK
jgi:hypothetical protein